ncbi:MAG TPA: hypothetical protein DCP92_01300 [Nitrospiraceae bacterium]|jgi:hypothetical protein|nr:hypothetical protein [Nitrospiraceae bacterium]
MKTDPSDEKLERLFAAARKAELYKPSRELELETRVMAKIRATHQGQMSFLSWTWRLVPALVCVVILLGIWTYATEPHYTVDFSAVAKIGNEETMLTAYLTGE